MEFHHRTVTVGGRRVAYWETNPDLTTPPLVIIHGLRANNRGFVPLARELSELRIICPDLPGMGKSEALDVEHTIERYAEFTRDFLQAVGISDYYLFGHSFGALIALACAHRYGLPRPPLVIVAPLAPGGLGQNFVSAFYRLAALFPAAARYRLLTSQLYHRPIRRRVIRRHDLYDELMEEGRIELTELNPKVHTENFRSILSTPVAKWLDGSVPVVAVLGEQDILAPPRRVKFLHDSPAIKTIMLPIGHFGPYEAPGQIAKVIREALSL